RDGGHAAAPRDAELGENACSLAGAVERVRTLVQMEPGADVCGRAAAHRRRALEHDDRSAGAGEIRGGGEAPETSPDHGNIDDLLVHGSLPSRPPRPGGRGRYTVVHVDL